MLSIYSQNFSMYMYTGWSILNDRHRQIFQKL